MASFNTFYHLCSFHDDEDHWKGNNNPLWLTFSSDRSHTLSYTRHVQHGLSLMRWTKSLLCLLRNSAVEADEGGAHSGAVPVTLHCSSWVPGLGLCVPTGGRYNATAHYLAGWPQGWKSSHLWVLFAYTMSSHIFISSLIVFKMKRNSWVVCDYTLNCHTLTY